MNTFEITFKRKTGNAWPVTVRHEPGGSSLALWSSGSLEIDLAQLNAAPAASKQYGLLLGKAVFREDIQAAFVRAVAEAKSRDEALRVFLNVEAEDLRALHWEQLCARFDRGWDHLLLNQQTPFSLYLPSQIERRFAPIGRRDLRALLLVAGTEDLAGDYDLASFDAAATIASLRASLGDIPCTVLGSVEGADGKPTLDELCEMITSRQPTLLHIVCHGRVIRSGGETALYFPKDEEGKPVTGTELIDRLGRLDRLPHFTFLSTCESAAPGAENGLGGMGQRLVRELGMPAVLAMTDRISIDTAGRLASSFYARLRENGEVDRALSEALAGLQGKSDVTVPALFSRLGGLPLFSESLNRPLTGSEIRFGLEELKRLVEERAPVLLPEVSGLASAVRPGLEAEPEALSPEMRGRFEAALEGLNQACMEVCDLSFNALALGRKPPPYDGRCPFRGLSPFRGEDREFFMGREALIRKLAGRLNEHPFLAVLGPSGAGKSSVVLAGLIPALNKEAAYLTPGTDPLAQLDSALDSREKVVVVDQFEELFTLTTDEAKRQRFIERLLKLKDGQQVVLTMRADFWGEVAAYPALKEEMQAHQELIAPMDGTELREAAERQAGRVGLRFEADLSQTILDDVSGEPGAMPLLQHALLLLWNRRHGRWLRAQEYRAIGGVQQAIARTAEDLYASLSAEEKERMRDIFLRLTRLDEEMSAGEHRDTRRRVGVWELLPAGGESAAVTDLVRRLADARLAVTSVNPASGQEEVEVAHEALIRYWPRLRSWLEEDRHGLMMREGLRDAALEWQAADREESLLVHRGRRLEEAVELSRQPRFTLNKAEQEYLDQCVALQERERAAGERRRRLTLISSVAVSVIMLLLAVFGFSQAAQANRQAALARAGELAAQALYNFDKRLDLSLLLSAEAYRKDDNVQTRSGLFVTLSTPYLDRFLAGHSGPVRAVVYSPDGRILATGGNDNTILLWDMGGGPTPRPMAVLQNEGEWVTGLAFSPDGTTLASGSQDSSVYLWDVSNPEAPVQAGRLSGHTAAVYSVAFSPDGKTLASGSADHDLILWDVSDKAAPRQAALLQAHQDLVLSAAFSPDGRLLASAGADQTLIFWDVSDPANPARLAERTGSNGEIYALAFSPDGQTLASGSLNGQITLWDFPTPSDPQEMPPLPQRHSDAVRSLAFSPDGRMLASGSKDNTIVLWDITRWNAIAQLSGHSAGIYSLAFSPDGQILASGSDDDRVILWHVLDRASPGQKATLAGPGAVLRLAASPDGNLLAVGNNDGSITLWNVSDPGRAHVLASPQGHPEGVFSLAFSPDGRILASAGADAMIRLVDISDPTMPRELSVLQGHSQPVLSLAFSPDGKTLASGGKVNTLLLWDVTDPASPRQRTALSAHTSFVNSLAFSPDGRTLASGSADHTVILWEAVDPSAPKRLSTLEGHTLEIYNIAFSPDGKMLASASADTSVIVWDVSAPAAPRRLSILAGHSGPVFDVTISPDGRTLASAAGDKTVVLWDLADPASPRQLAVLAGHSAAVYDLAFGRESRSLASASGDGTVILWDTDPGTLAGRACEVAGRNLTRAEWSEYFPGTPYRKTCGQWPEGE